MASKKKVPADLRTIDMFSGRTKLDEIKEKEQAAEEVIEEEERTATVADDRTLSERAEDTAIRWLGLDAFHEGDDVKVAVHPEGHAVVVLVNTHGPMKAPYGTQTFKLSRDQWRKLVELVRFESDQ